MHDTVLTWLGHSCFLLEHGGWRAVLDPYAPGAVPGLRPLSLTADAVYCSHGHRDHAGTECVRIAPAAPCPCRVLVYDSFHDDREGALRGKNEIRVFDFDGLRIAHLGDLGCAPSPETAEALTGLDCLLVPVGGHYTIGPDEAAELVTRLRPRAAIPMHYRAGAVGYDVIGTVDAFTRHFSPVTKTGSTVTLTSEGPSGILLMTPAMAE